MKHKLLVLLLLILPLCSIAQTRKYYCEVKGVEKELISGLKIVFDFGNNPVYSSYGLSNKQKLVDVNGKEIPFNSMVDAGNYLSDKGWNFVQAYTSAYGGQVIVHWIFVKEAESLEEAVQGILTKNEYNKQKK